MKVGSDLPYVSVVIPTRDRAGLLRDCLQSLLQQDYPSELFEIVVVDSASRDGTERAVADVALATRAPRIRYLRLERAGSNEARNIGISAGEGDPVCFLDDDEIAPPHWLGAMVRGARLFPHAGCYGGPMRLRLEGRAPRSCGRDALGESELDLGPDPVEAEYVWSGNMAIPRSTLAVTGPFPVLPRFGADEIELQERARAAGLPVVYLPEPWVWHRRTADQLRLFRLMTARFRVGRGQAVNQALMGRPYEAWKQRAALRECLRHAARERCTHGLIHAVQHFGRLVGIGETKLRFRSAVQR